MTNQHPTIEPWMLIFCSLIVAARVGGGEIGKYLGPCSMVPSRDGRMLYVALADAKQNLRYSKTEAIREERTTGRSAAAGPSNSAQTRTHVLAVPFGMTITIYKIAN